MEPIAIVGISCRFPGADNPEAFWRLLKDGGTAIREVPADRWDMSAFYDQDPSASGKMYTRWGGFLERLDLFDAAFFGISPREAERIDPQQRLLLELCWEALEDAGQVPARLRGSPTGVFIAFCVPEYQLAQMADPHFINSYTNTGYFPCIVSNRISYVFDFRGPSLSLDTACSASLVALHLACQSLRCGESTLALAGGVNLMVSPVTTIGYSKLGILSPENECRAFDARANGYVRGEGGGILLLKRLDAALADGDHIHAVIRGEAINQDGRSNGLTAPNRFAQEEVVKEAYRQAGVSPSDVQYVEAHGTGTLLGDSIEARALGAVVGAGRPNGTSCAIGSVKTNIGHLESAAGMASLMKVVLALKHRAIPPSVHFDTPSPHIPFEELGLKVQRAFAPWPDTTGRAVAGVHAYGFGGTNGHVVLEEAPAQSPVRGEIVRPKADATAVTDLSAGASGPHILTISAREPRALRDLAAAYRDELDAVDGNSISFGDICSSAALHRSHHDYRLAVVGASTRQAVEKLDKFFTDGSSPGVFSGGNTQGRRTRIAFLFTGQGSQYAGMGRTLYETHPVFRESLEQCDEGLRAYLSESLISVLFRDGDPLLNETAYTQPALFALEYALARLWHSWGVDPDVVMGHSVGEYAAACVAGVLSLADGLELIATRGRLMQDLPRDGAMAAVFGPEDQVRSAIAPFGTDVSIAAINGPAEITISGVGRSVDAALETLKTQGVAFQKLKVSHAFHSSLMEPMLDAFEQSARGVEYRAPRATLISNLTGAPIDGIPDAKYWRAHIRQPVLFSAGIQTIRELGCRWAIEIGPQPTLLDLAKRGVPREEPSSASGTGPRVWVPSLRRGRDEAQQMLESLAALYSQGLDVNWSTLYGTARRQRVKLPTYPFQRERCWFTGSSGGRSTSPSDSAIALTGPVVHPLLGRRHRSATVIFESQIGGRPLPYLQHHRVYGVCVLPAAAFLEMALAAAHEAFPSSHCRLENVLFQEPLVIDTESERTVQVTLADDDDADASFHVSSLDPNPGEGERSPWKRHVTGKLRVAEEHGSRGAAGSPALAEARDRCREALVPSDFYASFAAQGLEFGPTFRGVSQLWRGDEQALGLIRIHGDLADDASAYRFHPALLDSCVHVVAAALPADMQAATRQHTYIPVVLEGLHLYHPPGPSLWSHAVLRRPDGASRETLSVDIRIYEPSGEIAAEMNGLIVKRVERAQIESALPPPADEWVHALRWRHQPSPVRSSGTARERSNWVVFADGGGFGSALADRLASRGGRCVIVPRSEDIDEDGLLTLLQRVVGDCRNAPIGLVHAWTLDATAADDLTADRLRLSHQLGCGSILRILHALDRLEANVPIRLWLLTRGAQAVDTESSSPAVAQSPVWGLARTIQWEHAELGCTIVDLDPANDGDLPLVDEELHGDDRETQVAYRDGQRFVPRLVRGTMESAEHGHADAGTVIHADATYLITGGMGGLGLRVARWLVDQGARNLVLIGRQDRSSNVQHEIEELQQTANVAIAQADVARQDDMVRLFDEMREALPPVRGIVHAAGVLDNGLLSQQTVERFEKVAAPKLDGAWNLHVLSRDLALDFFVMFSSAASLLGSPGQGNYAAANAFLDALAHYRRAQGLPASTINWGPWAAVGMAAAADDRERARFDGLTVIRPELGVRVFGEVIRHGAPQTVALVADWARFLERFPAGQEPRVLSELAPGAARARREGEQTEERPLDLKRLVETAPVNQRHDVLVASLHDHVVHAMRLGQARSIDVRRPLAELGLDSMTAVELRNALADAVGRPLPASLLFDYPSIDALAGYLTRDVFGWEDVAKPAGAARTLAKVNERQPSTLYDDLSDEELAGRLAEKLARRTERRPLRTASLD